MRYVMYKDVRGEWRWRLYAANNQIIATASEGYRNRSDCLHSINLTKSSHSAPVQEVG